VDGVAGLEGRLGNLSHARKFVWRRVGGADRAWRGVMWRGKATVDLEM
jgi:hypothetical protein